MLFAPELCWFLNTTDVRAFLSCVVLLRPLTAGCPWLLKGVLSAGGSVWCLLSDCFLLVLGSQSRSTLR